MHDVFISYSSIDRRQAYAIRNYLKEKGLACWMAPESIPTGSNYTREIPVAIRNCQVFLLLLSEHSQNSPWVLRELDSAINNNKHILPYLLDESPMADEFQFLLTSCQWHLYWQENAMETLAERILTILPPKELPPSTPISEAVPEIPVPVSQEPPPANSTPSRELVICPACQSHNTKPLTNGKYSYLSKEYAWYLLAWLAGAAAYLPGRYILSQLLRYVKPLVHQIYYSTDRIIFNGLGKVVLTVLSLLFSVVVVILCHWGVWKWIRHRRFQQGFRANGICCSECSKKFRVSVPVMTRFPWEAPVNPVVHQPNVAVVRCPSCGIEEVIPRKRDKGSYNRKERWYFLPAWLAGAAISSPLAVALYRILWYFPFLRRGPHPAYGINGLGILLMLVGALAATYGIAQLVRIPLREYIRRKRIRQHVRSCGFHCPDCNTDFRLVIPLAKKFPHEVSDTSAESGICQGKTS